MRALAAMLPLAQVTIDTDLRGLRIVQIKLPCITQAGRISDVTSQSDGEALGPRTVIIPGAAHGFGNRKVSRLIRQLHHLRMQPSGIGECLMYIPNRTGPALIRESKLPGRKPLRHIPGDINAEKEKRDAACIRII